jgi:pimeloyl-ACP methyl ester carboxylesterase
MPTPADFQQWRDAYHAVAPHPEHFDALLEKTSTMVRSFPGFEPDALRTITAPALLVFGDTDFTPLRNAVEMLDLIPNAQLAVLPGTTHMGVTRSGERLRGLIEPFLGDGEGRS